MPFVYDQYDKSLGYTRYTRNGISIFGQYFLWFRSAIYEKKMKSNKKKKKNTTSRDILHVTWFPRATWGFRTFHVCLFFPRTPRTAHKCLCSTSYRSHYPRRESRAFSCSAGRALLELSLLRVHPSAGLGPTVLGGLPQWESILPFRTTECACTVSKSFQSVLFHIWYVSLSQSRLNIRSPFTRFSLEDNTRVIQKYVKTEPRCLRAPSAWKYRDSCVETVGEEFEKSLARRKYRNRKKNTEWNQYEDKSLKQIFLFNQE